jgi:hypothetical protein
MREADAPSTGSARLQSVPAPPGVVILAPPTTQRNASGAQCEGRAREGHPKSAAKGNVEAGVLHLASLQRGSLILREDCYNVVTRAPTVGNDSVVPDSKRERRVCSLCSSGYSQRWRW